MTQKYKEISYLKRSAGTCVCVSNWCAALFNPLHAYPARMKLESFFFTLLQGLFVFGPVVTVNARLAEMWQKSECAQKRFSVSSCKPQATHAHLTYVTSQQLLHKFLHFSIPNSLKSQPSTSKQQKQHLSGRYHCCHVTKHLKVTEKQSIFSVIHFLCGCQQRSREGPMLGTHLTSREIFKRSCLTP